MLYDIVNISYSYLGRFAALKGIDLKVEKGERIALLGANGSGKSTLLLILAGLVFPDEGSLRFLGTELKEETFSDPAFQEFFRRRVGIVFQNSDVQLFNSNVRDEILFGLVQMGLSKQEIEHRLDGYMELMHIAHLKDRHPQYLSIGEKKRVALASVLAMEPEVILLDEPTSGLDPRTTRCLIDSIRAFSLKGCTIISSTQDIHIVPEIADRVVVLSEDKRKVKDAGTEDVLNDLVFLKEHNLIHEHRHEHRGIAHIHPHQHPSHDHPHQ